MNSKQIKEVCIRELLFDEQFLRIYQNKLHSLHSNQGFMHEVKQISKSVPLELEFSCNKKNKDFLDFKLQQISHALFSANAYRNYADYHDIVEDVKARGNTGLSATISIYYAMRYMDYDAESAPEVSPSKSSVSPQPSGAASDADFRTKWPAEYRCDDGHKVRSKGEQLVDNWLYHHNICHGYEPLVRDKRDHREYISDFYIPQYRTYIEVWGLETPEYLNRKARKIEVYKANNLKLIHITDDDIKILDDFMRRNLP